MAQYIKKSDIVAEIEKRIKETESMQPKFDQFWAGQISAFKGVLKILDTIEVKDIEDLQGVEKEVADNWISRLDSKRIPITLKGELKGKFINEFNTLWQTVGKLQFANVAKAIIERMCLHFAAWGSYNLRDYIKINAEESSKLDTLEVKEVDFPPNYLHTNIMPSYDTKKR